MPTVVAGPLGEKSVVAVAGGEHHTIALTSEGEVFGFGKNDDGQCGLGDTYTEFRKIHNEKQWAQNAED